MPRLTTLTVTDPARWAGMAEMSRLMPLVTVKQPGAGAGHSTTVAGVPAANSAAVPISMAVAPLRLVPVTVTSLPPPAGPLVGMTARTTGAAGTVPAGAFGDVAGLASLEDATALVLPWTRAGVTAAEFTTPFTVIVPLVNGLVLFVHDICCPLGAPHTHPAPEAPTGTTPLGKVSVTVTGKFSAAPEEPAATVYVTGLPGTS